MPAPRFRFFLPILAGATLGDRLLACAGAILGIGLCALVFRLSLGEASPLALLVAPLGASAVLLFAVPASPLAQPWPVLGGNTLSALVGVAVAQVVPEPALAAGLAVGLAIGAMSLTRCLHPPGGAAALTAVLGGPSVAAAGWLFPLLPVALDSLLLLLLAIAFHRLSGRNYPHVAAPAPAPAAHDTADPPPLMRAGFRMEDVDGALAALHETFDIDRADIDRLLREVEQRALERMHGELACSAIMSRDVVTIGPEAEAATARTLMLEHNIRTLPVVDGDGVLLGTVGLRELASAAGPVGGHLAAPALAAPGDPAVALLPLLTDGRRHAVMVVGAAGHIEGIVTQTDLLAALARTLPLKGVVAS